MRIFPESAWKPLQKVLWFSLDNNYIRGISETSLYNLGELQYLNLEANKLATTPANIVAQERPQEPKLPIQNLAAS